MAAVYLPNQLAATREGFGQGLLELAPKMPELMVVCADLTKSLGLAEFAQRYPDKFVQVGVAEQNLISVAAGLALGGRIVFAASFAAFNPGRTFDQLRNVAYSQLPVIAVGGHAGLATGEDGAIHQALEDIALTNCLPNFTVLAPADAEQARQATQALAAAGQPAYLRLTRPQMPTLTHADQFEIGPAEIYAFGKKATILSYGPIINQARTAIEEIDPQAKNIGLINFPTLKPLDQDTILTAANRTHHLLTIEDHQLIGGLGQLVGWTLATHPEVKADLINLAVNDQFGESGKTDELWEKYGLGINQIKSSLEQLLTD